MADRAPRHSACTENGRERASGEGVVQHRVLNRDWSARKILIDLETIWPNVEKRACLD